MTDEEFRQRLDRLDRDIAELKHAHKNMAAKIGVMETQDAVATVHRENVEKRLTSIEDTLKWLVRLVVGAIVLAFLAWVLGGGLSGAPALPPS